MSGEIAMYILSGLIILLGGVALFLQKIYRIDSGTEEKTVIELPFFGKMSTNFPALAFVFIGAALAGYTLKITWESEVPWVISGKFGSHESKPVIWEQGNLRLSPKKYHKIINPDGTFEIQIEIRKGRKFEEEVGQISYENCSCDGRIFGGRILVDNEYKRFIKHEKGLLASTGEKTRRYKEVEVSVALRPTGTP